MREIVKLIRQVRATFIRKTIRRTFQFDHCEAHWQLATQNYTITSLESRSARLIWLRAIPAGLFKNQQ